jgi:hypothetical protein
MTDNTMALDRESPSGENAVPGLGSWGVGIVKRWSCGRRTYTVTPDDMIALRSMGAW